MNASSNVVQRGSIVAASVITATLTWYFMHEIADVALAVRSGGTVRDIGVGAVAVTAALAALAGWGLLALLERRASRPRRTWTVIAVIVFAVSLLGAASGASAAAQGSILGLHSVVAAVVIAGLGRTAAPERR
ncbi:DUF6069 family protein [Catellatospora methionotrophica]|uniref:DUF6069 family protein n=1 Tax=Catellatospora methionotrophica TaxID=121620 RepID=UPI0033F6D559